MIACFVGIDIGTQGVRGALVTQTGEVLGEVSKKFVLTPESRAEQSPEDWWEHTQEVMDELKGVLSGHGQQYEVLALGVDSTSGTVIPLDADNKPLHPAIMYSDPRSAKQGERCKSLAGKYIGDGYTGFNSSSGLSKMVWFVDVYREKVPLIQKWVHASDYITGMLCGRFDVTDYTNALKSGYDLVRLEWPDYLTDELPLKQQWLQEVVPSGTPVGQLDPALAQRWGMPKAQVVVGMTDGCASQIASGAVTPGAWNTTLGTTLVIKGVTEGYVHDPEGRLYSHRHPEGYWMPGGASNTGADWVSMDFGTDLESLNAAASTLIPTGLLAWPLKQKGERFPVIAPLAQGFFPEDLTPVERFASGMEGVAYIERMAYELIEELSGEKVDAVYTAGGGSNSDTWLRIRANVLNRPIHKCRETSGAVGAAIGAASKTFFDSVLTAASKMTAVEYSVLPDVELSLRYEESYAGFLEELKTRGYL